MTDFRPPDSNASPPAMPPLGPPYVAPPGRPPPPQFPPAPPTSWPAPPPLLPAPVPPPPSGPRWADRLKRPVVIWGAVAIVMAIILGALVGRSTNDDLSPTASGPTTTTRPRSTTTTEPANRSTTTTAPQDLDTVVEEIERFVERERGLKFKTDVDVHLAGEGEFQNRLLADFDEEHDALVEEQQVLTALRLVPEGSDVIGDYKSLLEIGVVGFYDPKTKQLVVRGTSTTPYVRQVLAHELTHALDDQWFNLDRPELDNPDDDSGFGFLGLVEGNARRIENAYTASMSFDERADATAEEQGLVLQHPEILRLPRILLTLLQAPYDEGPTFVEALVDHGGQEALDRAFSAPPVSSEQILDPQRFFSGDVPKELAPPPADGAVLNNGVLGELLLREMFFESSAADPLADDAIDGWGGDRYVTWTDTAGGSCLRDEFMGDTAADTSELLDAMRAWAQDNGGTVTTTGDRGTLTICSS